MSTSRDTRVVKVLVAILVANVAVALSKLAYGQMSGSLAIRADGLHSLLDGVNNVVALIALRAASRPADAGHPYGHRKFEVLASLAIGLLLLGVAVKTGLSAWGAMVADAPLTIGGEAFIVLAGTLVVNAVVAHLEHRAGKRWDSMLLIADARHTLSDVFVTLGVIAGVAGVRLGYPRADAIAAAGVAVLIAVIGIGIVRSAVAALADEAAIPAEMLAREVGGIDGVLACSRIRSRRSASEVLVDLVVEVDRSLSLARAHAIADRVEATIKSRWPDVTDVVVHVEPDGHATAGEP